MANSPEKPFTSLDEQIQILKHRNLIIEDESSTKSILSKYGYYKIINGYGEQFEEEHNVDEKKYYIDGTTFNDIFLQYSIDKFFSRIIIRDLLDIEQRLKTSLGYVVAKDFGVYHQSHNKVTDKEIILKPSYGAVDLFPTSYLDKRNYDTNNNPYSNVEELFDIISETKRDPLAYYRDHRSHIPPWILFDQVEFGKINRYFKSLKPNTKLEILNQFINASNLEISTDTYLYQNFFGFMELIRQYRNAFAHSSRFIASKFKENSLSLKFKNYLATDELYTKSEYRSGIGKGDLFSLLILLTVFSYDIWTAKNQINFYKRSLDNFIKDWEQQSSVASSDKAVKAFMAASGLPDNYSDRLNKLADNIF